MPSIDLSKFVCYLELKDTIPSLLLLQESYKPNKDILVICEQSHILSFSVTPGREVLESSTMQECKGFMDQYADFLNSKKFPYPLYEQVIFAENFLIFGHKYGASLAMRRIVEAFITDNYGTYVWDSGSFANGKNHLKKEIADKVRTVGVYTILRTLSGKEVNPDDELKRKLITELKDKKAKTDTDRVWLDEADYFSLLNTYDLTSDYIHYNKEPRPIDISNSLRDLLTVLQSYFNKKNEWGVIYE